MIRPPVKFTVRHVGRSTIQEMTMDTTDKPTLAEAMALPEVRALVEAARKVHRSFWYSSDGVIQGMYDLEMSLAPFTAAQGDTK